MEVDTSVDSLIQNMSIDVEDSERMDRSFDKNDATGMQTQPALGALTYENVTALQTSTASEITKLEQEMRQKLHLVDVQPHTFESQLAKLEEEMVRKFRLTDCVPSTIEPQTASVPPHLRDHQYCRVLPVPVDFRCADTAAPANQSQNPLPEFSFEGMNENLANVFKTFRRLLAKHNITLDRSTVEMVCRHIYASLYTDNAH
ncbi:unnamed protein product [Mesocestoides corti]|uniref:Uncharacterized protein n=1 Tax=Mesocestoides corti TaxID=53468 RepID=A0A0R3UPM2_MESCO|nr:unnamed protein product [Mesocestoides corti]